MALLRDTRIRGTLKMEGHILFPTPQGSELSVFHEIVALREMLGIMGDSEEALAAFYEKMKDVFVTREEYEALKKRIKQLEEKEDMGEG